MAASWRKAMVTAAETAAFLERNSAAKDFTRWAQTLVATGDMLQARRAFAVRFPRSKHIDLIQRAVIEPGTTTGADWAGPISPVRPLGSAFMELIRPLSAIGQMRGFRTVPFNIKFPTQTAASQPGWVGQNAPIKFSQLAFEETSFDVSKVAGLIAMSKELARSSDPAAEALFALDLSLSIAAFADQEFLDPSKAEDDVSPASVTYGAPSVVASGTTADALRADARNLVEQMRGEGAAFRNPYWVMSPAMRLSLSLMDGGLLRDGKLGEVPVATTGASIADGNSPDDQRMFLLDASEIMLADDGLEIDISEHATVQMDSAPDSPPTGATVLVNLWQRNLVGLRAIRFIRWQARAAGAAGYIAGARYGS
jgi:hypothetical protein